MKRLSSLFIFAVLLVMGASLAQGQAIPTQLAPANGATLSSPVIPFQWSAVSNVRIYVLKVKSADGTYKWKGKATPSVAGCADLSSCAFTPSDFDWSLKHQTSYTWKVITKFNDGTKSNTTASQFSTNFPVPGAFTLISPANNASFQDSFTASFQWNPSANTNLYKVVVKNSSGTTILKTTLAGSACGTVCQYNFGSQITTSGTYKWKVVAKNSYGKTKAGANSFSVVGSAPSYADEMLRLVNVERCSRGLEPLALNDTLNSVALEHSEDMAINNYFAHDSLDGRTPWDRMHNAGYYFIAAGENIAAGYSDAQSTFVQWWGSEGHRNNILNPNVREMGIGHAYNSSATYRNYWTQVFGARNSTVLGTCP